MKVKKGELTEADIRLVEPIEARSVCREFYLRGVSIRLIGEKFGFTEANVRRWLRVGHGEVSRRKSLKKLFVTLETPARCIPLSLLSVSKGTIKVLARGRRPIIFVGDLLRRQPRDLLGRKGVGAKRIAELSEAVTEIGEKWPTGVRVEIDVDWDENSLGYRNSQRIVERIRSVLVVEGFRVVFVAE